jgi:hypothetical protein
MKFFHAHKKFPSVNFSRRMLFIFLVISCLIGGCSVDLVNKGNKRLEYRLGQERDPNRISVNMVHSAPAGSMAELVLQTLSADMYPGGRGHLLREYVYENPDFLAKLFQGRSYRNAQGIVKCLHGSRERSYYHIKKISGLFSSSETGMEIRNLIQIEIAYGDKQENDSGFFGWRDEFVKRSETAFLCTAGSSKELPPLPDDRSLGRENVVAFFANMKASKELDENVFGLTIQETTGRRDGPSAEWTIQQPYTYYYVRT